MRIYQLTSVGNSLARTPTNNLTPGWKIVYFLKRHGGRATDDQISAFLGLSPEQIRSTMSTLTRGKNPVIAVISN